MYSQENRKLMLKINNQNFLKFGCENELKLHRPNIIRLTVLKHFYPNMNVYFSSIF